MRDRVQSLKLPLPEERTGGSSVRFAWSAAVLLLVTNAILGYQLWAERQKAQASPTPPPVIASDPDPSTTPASSMEKPATDPNQIVLESKGYIIPAHQILVSPKVSGMVMSLNIEEGMRVAKGEILAEIEKTEYQAEYDRAKATLELMKHRLSELENGSRPEEIAQAEAELSEAEANLREMERDYTRERELRKRKASSEEAFTAAESTYLAQVQRVARLKAALELLREGPRKERIAAARAEVAQAQADLERAEWRLQNCTIRSPISGTILKKNAEEANIVNPVAFNGSFSLCEMADLSDLEVELDIQERDVSKVFRGQKCTVRAEAFPDREYKGHVSRLMPIANRAKGAVPVRVKVAVPAEEEGVYLKPEMGAIVTFLASATEEPGT